MMTTQECQGQIETLRGVVVGLQPASAFRDQLVPENERTPAMRDLFRNSLKTKCRLGQMREVDNEFEFINGSPVEPVTELEPEAIDGEIIAPGALVPYDLVARIKQREDRIREHVRSVLKLAIEQGDDLLALKAITPHGEFKELVEQRASVSYREAARYMKAAGLFKSDTRVTFDPNMSLTAYLKQHATPRQVTARPNELERIRDLVIALKLKRRGGPIMTDEERGVRDDIIAELNELT